MLKTKVFSVFWQDKHHISYPHYGCLYAVPVIQGQRLLFAPEFSSTLKF